MISVNDCLDGHIQMNELAICTAMWSFELQLLFLIGCEDAMTLFHVVAEWLCWCRNFFMLCLIMGFQLYCYMFAVHSCWTSSDNSPLINPIDIPCLCSRLWVAPHCILTSLLDERYAFALPHLGFAFRSACARSFHVMPDPPFSS